MLKKIILTVLIACSLSLLHCSRTSSMKDSIKVGTISGPETELMHTAADIAEKKYGLKVEIVEFSDYTLPNLALNDGSLDANVFQHLPYLEQSIESRHYHLVPIGKTFIYPMGIYSKKIKNLKDLTSHATIGIPNDPSNEVRALLLLQKAGLIQLKLAKNQNYTLSDITKNPKELKFKELDAAQLPRSLDDMDLAVINSNYAVPAGLSPTHDALFIEGKDSNYVNLIVSRKDNAQDPRLVKLVEALHSKEVIDKAHQLFQGEAMIGWDEGKY